MKLGAAYNIFDGIELLSASINSIRDNTDFICCVYQRISNSGNKICETKLTTTLNETSKFVDVWHEYLPNLSISGYQNEVIKRNIGCTICQEHGCTHVLTMDVDEFYINEEIRKAKEIIEAENLDTTVCMMIEYYKTNSHSISVNDYFNVPFIYKLTNRKYDFDIQFPYNVDPTRRMQANKIKLFTRNELQMHHMTWIRDDIRLKLCNSSGSIRRWGSIENIDKIGKYYDEWKDGMPGMVSIDRYVPLTKITPVVQL